MTELLRVYEEMYNSKQEYCVICLRSGRERRMVAIHNLELFVKSINLPFNYNYDFQRVCWACSRAAAAAHRLRLAVNLSASVHSLFSLMSRSRQRGADVARQLRGEAAPVGIVQQAMEWEARLSGIRARNTLLQTEVLVVASVPPSEFQAESEAARAAPPASPAEEPDVYLIPDEPPPSPAPSPSPPPPPAPAPPPPDVLSEPEIFMDSVIIEDDERDPIAIKREPPPPSPPAPPSPPPLPPPGPCIVPLERLVEDACGGGASFLLHPIVERAGVMSVPTLRARIVDGQLKVDDTPVAPVPVTPAPAPAPAAPRLALQDRMLFNLLSEASRGTEAPSPALVASGRDLLLHTLMTGKPFSDNNVITHSIIIDDEEPEQGRGGRGEAGRGEAGRGEAGRGRRKRDRDKGGEGPPSKRRETDWEDKIPMDVISYVDATDPNAKSVLSPDPALGIIAAVRSVSEEAHSAMDTTPTHSPAANTPAPYIINSALSTNSAPLGTNSVQSGTNSVQLVINSVKTGKKSVQSGINSVQSGINSVQSGIISSQSGILTSLLEKNSVKSRTSGASTQSAGARNSAAKGRRGARAAGGHKNVFPKNGTNPPADVSLGDVIDLR